MRSSHVLELRPDVLSRRALLRHRLVRWVNETYKSGSHGQLVPLLERCTRELKTIERYRSDVRYLRIWIQYVSYYETQPKGKQTAYSVISLIGHDDNATLQSKQSGMSDTQGNARRVTSGMFDEDESCYERQCRRIMCRSRRTSSHTWRCERLFRKLVVSAVL